MRAGLMLLALCVLTFASCRDPFGGGDEEVRVVLEEDRVVVSNRSSDTIYYLALNPRALIQVALCLGPQCPHLEPGDSAAIPFSLVAGWEGDPDADAVEFHYWRLVADGAGGWRADRVKKITAR